MKRKIVYGILVLAVLGLLMLSGCQQPIKNEWADFCIENGGTPTNALVKFDGRVQDERVLRCYCGVDRYWDGSECLKLQ